MNRPRKKDGHLPKCVYFVNGAHWHVKKNKWTRLPKEGPSTLKAAMEAYAQLFEAPATGIDKLIDATLEQHIRIEKLSANTSRSYRNHAKYLKKALQEFAPEQVRAKHAFAIKRALSETPGKANITVSLGKILFGYWLEDELVESNPFTDVSPYQMAGRDRLPSEDEYQRIYAKADAELQIIMDLWRGTAQRVWDVIRIKRADLKPEGIEFVQQKTGKKLTVKWTPEMRAAADRARKLYGNLLSVYLVHNRRGKPLSAKVIDRRWRTACQAAGVKDLQRRDLRAMAATEAEEQGLDATALLGHSDRRTTKIYLRNRKSKVVEGPSFRQAIDK